jgi:hypothetical protein
MKIPRSHFEVKVEPTFLEKEIEEVEPISWRAASILGKGLTHLLGEGIWRGCSIDENLSKLISFPEKASALNTKMEIDGKLTSSILSTQKKWHLHQLVISCYLWHSKTRKQIEYTYLIDSHIALNFMR